LIARNIKSTTFRWLKMLCKPGFGGSKYYVNSDSLAQNNM